MHRYIKSVQIVDNTQVENEEIIIFLCHDMGIEVREVEPMYWQLHKLGYESAKVMTLSLTTQFNGKWKIGNSINQVYNQIINNFKI